jgi:hypothetical protein
MMHWLMLLLVLPGKRHCIHQLGMRDQYFSACRDLVGHSIEPLRFIGCSMVKKMQMQRALTT